MDIVQYVIWLAAIAGIATIIYLILLIYRVLVSYNINSKKIYISMYKEVLTNNCLSHISYINKDIPRNINKCIKQTKDGFIYFDFNYILGHRIINKAVSFDKNIKLHNVVQNYDMILYNDMIEELYKEGLFENHLLDLVNIIKDDIYSRYDDFNLDISESQKTQIKNNMLNYHRFNYIIKDNIELFI